MKYIILNIFCLMAFLGVAWAEPSEVVLQTISMEAANQPIEGQALVALTLINRARIRSTTPEVEALRPKQYSCWNDKKQAQIWLSRHFDSQTRSNALSALETAVMRGNRHITHYHTRSIIPYWAKGKTPTICIADHCFYEGIK